MSNIRINEIALQIISTLQGAVIVARIQKKCRNFLLNLKRATLSIKNT